ncbi:alpha/beta fold hydrolase [Kribbella solani]|uniref:alpha/beta fold hydrolase n=1 Tax=Kribbella solani TaxID=236067 RepID=UPI0038D3D25D
MVGCSMGGGTALEYTLEHPEQVHGLVLLRSNVSGTAETELDDDPYLQEDPAVYDRLPEVQVPVVQLTNLREPQLVIDAIVRLAGDYDAG